MPRFAHITRGKAGSQWVRDVLADPEIIRRQGVRLRRPDAWYDMRSFAAEADGTFVAPLDNVAADQWNAHKREGDRCVVVLRDPRDAMVSWAFSMAFSHLSEENVALIRPALLALDLRGKLEIAAYVSWVRAPMSLSWAEHERSSDVMVCRFEDLIADEVAAFQAIFSHLGWNVDEDVVRAVVDRHSFARRSAGRERGSTNSFSHLRSAVAGNWKEYLDRDVARRFEQCAPGYMRRLGYEQSDDWWTALPERLPALTSGARTNELQDTAARLLDRFDGALDELESAAER